MLDSVVNFITTDQYLQALGWFITIVSGGIAIIKLFGFSKPEVKSYNKEKQNVNLGRQVKAICSDCKSYVSKNSATCVHCGSIDPFNTSRLISILKYKLNSVLDIATLYSHPIENIKLYVYGFIPFTLISMLALFFVEVFRIQSGIIYGGLSVLIFLYVIYLFLFPHIIVGEHISFGQPFIISEKISSEKLINVRDEVNYIINSASQKNKLKKLKIIIEEYEKSIIDMKNIRLKNFKLLLSLIGILLATLYFIIVMIQEAFYSILSRFNFEYAIVLVGLLFILYFQTKAVFKIYWINFIYFDYISKSYNENHIRSFIDKIDQKILSYGSTE